MVASTTPEPPAPLDDGEEGDAGDDTADDDVPALAAPQGVALLRSVFPGRVIRILRPPATTQAGAAAEPAAVDETVVPDPDQDPDIGGA